MRDRINAAGMKPAQFVASRPGFRQSGLGVRTEGGEFPSLQKNHHRCLPFGWINSYNPSLSVDLYGFSLGFEARLALSVSMRGGAYNGVLPYPQDLPPENAPNTPGCQQSSTTKYHGRPPIYILFKQGFSRFFRRSRMKIWWKGRLPNRLRNPLTNMDIFRLYRL